MPLTALSSEESTRYSRHLLLPEVGTEGQARLRTARVLLIGAGGLGSPIALYLAAAGIGHLGIVEDDRVELSNIQRQILYGTADIGAPKLPVAAARIAALNPHVTVTAHAVRFTAENALLLAAGYDLLIDASDNFPTRYLVNDTAVLLRKPNVSGSVLRFEGQVTCFDATRGPCYRCLYPAPPPPAAAPNCAAAGVLGVVPGLIGLVQATEAIKWILGIGETLCGRLLLVDALTVRFRELRFAKDPHCPACGTNPTIRAPVEFDVACPTTAAPELTVVALKARLERGDPLVLIDVREPFEYAICHLPGGQLIPLGQLAVRCDELDKTQEIVLYCHRGNRSLYALRQLQAAGFTRCWNLQGGVQAWAREIDPEMPTY